MHSSRIGKLDARRARIERVVVRDPRTPGGETTPSPLTAALPAHAGRPNAPGLVEAHVAAERRPDHDEQRRHVGRHQHEVLRHLDADRGDARDERLDAAEQDRAEERPPRVPAGEDDQRDGDPAAAAGHAVDPDLGDGDGEIAAGEADQRRAGGDRPGAVERDVDAGGIGGLRVLADRAES